MRQKIRLFVDIFVFGAIITLVVMLTNKTQVAVKQVQENKQAIQENRALLMQILEEVKNDSKGD